MPDIRPLPEDFQRRYKEAIRGILIRRLMVVNGAISAEDDAAW